MLHLKPSTIRVNNTESNWLLSACGHISTTQSLSWERLKQSKFKHYLMTTSEVNLSSHPYYSTKRPTILLHKLKLADTLRSSDRRFGAGLFKLPFFFLRNIGLSSFLEALGSSGTPARVDLLCPNCGCPLVVKLFFLVKNPGWRLNFLDFLTLSRLSGS